LPRRQNPELIFCYSLESAVLKYLVFYHLPFYPQPSPESRQTMFLRIHVRMSLFSVSHKLLHRPSHIMVTYLASTEDELIRFQENSFTKGFVLDVCKQIISKTTTEFRLVQFRDTTVINVGSCIWQLQHELFRPSIYMDNCLCLDLKCWVF